MDTGNTFLGRTSLVTISVQPRGYGEHDDSTSKLDDICGSAPWIRGTLKLFAL